MNFEIVATIPASNETVKFSYDNTTNTLVAENGVVFEFTDNKPVDGVETRAFHKDDPLLKSKHINVLKIQLGLSCNYSCDYCSQKFVERPPETSSKDIEEFMSKLDVLEFSEEKGLRVEFWGGEPMVYWKTLKPLTEAIQKKFSSWKKKPLFSMVTNGSLLTKEKCAWLYYNGFSIGISHDGPGQSVRGPDPLDDPKTKETILEFYHLMRKQNRISFNTMLNKKNISRKAVYDYFVELTGDPEVAIGEGSLIDAYDEDGSNSSLHTLEEHFSFRRNAFAEFISNNMNFTSQNNKVNDFVHRLLSHTPSKFLYQKCNMDAENIISVDLKGNIITCQNVSVLETSKNGEPHLGGNLDDYDNVAIKGVTHWKNRKNCSNCPVLHVCKGSCMYLDGKYWDTTCENSYTDNVVMFAVAFFKITGLIPVHIIAEGLPLSRQDIWGTLFDHKEKPKSKLESIPVRVVAEKEGSIDDVEVYGKSRIITEE